MCALVSIGERTQAEELGRVARRLLEEQGSSLVGVEHIPDDPIRLKGLLVAALADPRIEIAITVGGSENAGTVEVVESLMERRVDGFGEVFRHLTYQEIGSAAIYARASAGYVRGRVLLALPGTMDTVRRGLEKLALPELSRLLAESRGAV